MQPRRSDLRKSLRNKVRKQTLRRLSNSTQSLIFNFISSEFPLSSGAYMA